MRLGVLFDNFGPYHMARLNALSRKANVVGIEVRPNSFEYAWGPTERPATLGISTLLGSTDGLATWRTLTAALKRLVSHEHIDAIAIPGWYDLPALRTALWALEAKIPAVVMSDSSSGDLRRRPITERTKSRLVAMFSAGLAAGEQQRAYLASLGMKRDAIFLGYDAVDNDYFAAGAAETRTAGRRPALSSDRILPAEWAGRYFLASGRMLAMKNQAALLDAYAAYRRDADTPWPLVLLGDGPMRPDLERKCAELGLDGSVFMPGFKPYADLPLYYGTAGAFVHVSTLEPWGLVVNEAMASGLPVIVSSACGCASTLVRHARNGFIVAADDARAIASALGDMATSGRRGDMAAASRMIVADWGVDRFATGMRDAADYACAHPVTHLPFGQAALCRAIAEINNVRQRWPQR